MNYFKIDKFDSVDGPGIRVGFYVSGCTHKCQGCHSSDFWDFETGNNFTDETLTELKMALSEFYISGLSILGGDPLEKENIETVAKIIDSLTLWYESMYNKPLNIWLWTGSIYEQLGVTNSSSEEYQRNLNYILSKIDVLVDGPYIESKRNLDLAFRGSDNQRLIDMKETRKCGNVVLYKEDNK